MEWYVFGGRMRLIATLTEAASRRRYLDGVGRPAELPLIAPARPPPPQSLDFAALKDSNSNAVCHRRHAGDLRSKIIPPTL